MRKRQKEQAENGVKELYKLHDQIKNNLDKKSIALVDELLTACQSQAIAIGNLIEESMNASSQNEGVVTVSYLEEYCELVFTIHTELQSETNSNSNKILKKLNKSVIKIENNIRNDIRIRKEAVFLPYKASMWDSLESVWMAADADPDCDAYVIPIPYYDKNPDGSYKQLHYEADMFPDYVPITNFEDFDFGIHHPDMIFIHNPYDDSNFVTTVHPFFYSDKMKKCTDCLVYIPYFATAGGMSEGQALCPGYINADYIVIQSEKYRKFYDSRISDSKFLAFGSPKFDSVIRKCQNPPKPPAEWEEMMTKEDGSKKKVYFYNTSIGGMLDNTENFLKKMEYVFNTFKEHPDSCLLWRPHPLLESTFDSMRKQYRPWYEALKRKYIDEKIGIFDTTPSIDSTIALSDVYIGDAATSVTSLFGVTGKPLFIMNNMIHSLPGDDDWKGTVYQTHMQTWDGMDSDKYCVTHGNKLYYSPQDNGQYQYFCDLSEYSGGGYYNRAHEFGDKIYVFPSNAQHILVITRNKKINRIELRNEIEQSGAFSGCWIYKDYAFLLPYKYPFLIRFHMKTEQIDYISGVRDFHIANVNGSVVTCARWISKGKMHFINPNGNQLLSIDLNTLAPEVKDINVGTLQRIVCYAEMDSDEVWLLPYAGTTLKRWNMITNTVKEYDLSVEGLQAIHRRFKTECNINIFSSITFNGEKAIVAPEWGNKFIELDIETGMVQEWKSPFDTSANDISPYRVNTGIGYWYEDINDFDKKRFYYNVERKLYDIDIETKKISEVKFTFDREEIYVQADGFCKESQWMQYCCRENVFNSLNDLVEDTLHGRAFDKELQIKEFSKINASVNGDCGDKVYQYMTNK